jgi:hypothetical protein
LSAFCSHYPANGLSKVSQQAVLLTQQTPFFKKMSDSEGAFVLLTTSAYLLNDFENNEKPKYANTSTNI